MALSSSSISSVGQLFSMKRKIAEGEIDEAGSERGQSHSSRIRRCSCRSGVPATAARAAASVRRVDRPGVQNPERDRLGAAGRQDDMAGEDIDELVGERGAVDRIGRRFDIPMIRIGGAVVVLAESFAECLVDQAIKLADLHLRFLQDDADALVGRRIVGLDRAQQFEVLALERQRDIVSGSDGDTARRFHP